jgi:hypothetical protein
MTADDRDAERAAQPEPAPKPSASGSPPNNAAMVVIMMDGSAAGTPGGWRRGLFALLAPASSEVDHHDAFFLTMPISRMSR